MYPVSESFLEAIGRSGRRKIVADVFFGNQYVPILSDIPVIDGSLNVDRNSRSRRSGSLTLGDASLFPEPLISDTGLEPYGAEIAIKCGIVYPNGSEEIIPMGIFLIESVHANIESGGLPEVEFYDRAHRVYETSTHIVDGSEHKFVGQLINTAIVDVIEYSAPGYPDDALFSCTVDPGLPQIQVPGGYLAGETDRWTIVEKMAQALGAEAYFDVFGRCQVKPPPTITAETPFSSAVWTVAAGADGVLVKATRTLSRENTYNAVIVLGSTPANGGDQPYGIAIDNSSSSKTGWDGLFGKKTLRIDNSLLTSPGQCQAAATATLSNVLGLSRNISFEALFNPALDGGDIIKVVFPNGVTELHLIDSISFNFGSSWSMTATTRTAQYTT